MTPHTALHRSQWRTVITYTVYVLLCCLFTFKASAQARELAIVTLYSSNQCGINEALFKQIKTAAQIKKIINKNPQALFSPQPINLPDVDFNTQYVLLISVGQKNQSGYNIVLDAQHATRDHHTLNLPIRLSTPDKNKAYAQVFTSPCKIIAVEKAHYHHVKLANKTLRLN